ncbi:MAG TPA: hypothetical protein VF510_15905 [Ktedonobacterales bacterium]
MSEVTNAILYYGNGSDRVLEGVNKFFDQVENQRQRGFVSMDDPSLPHGWYGGAKMLEGELAIGAFNYLDVEALVEYLCQQCAKNELDPSSQLILQEQWEDRFRIINIDDEMRRRGMHVPEAW